MANEKLTPLQEEAIENLQMWLRNPQGINLGAALGYTELDIAHLISLAFKLLEEGKLENARTLYEGIHALNPDNVDAMMGLGSIYTHQGHTEQAIELFGRVLEEDPSNTFALLQRGECYIKVGGEEQLKQAVEDFKKVMELDPQAESREAKRALAIINSAREVAQEGGTIPEDIKEVTKNLPSSNA
ncbi:MAG: tetratricopeptide repeat protein [Deltaproteobacteria bacterium]|nr:MAG: tetratricopeptide repeat protein [Deltaproteobacteria bacterium]